MDRRTWHLCVVPGCSDTYSSRHQFPNRDKDRKRFDVWLQLVQNPNLLELDPKQVFTNYSVCHQHFTVNDKSSNMFLVRTAIPIHNLPPATGSTPKASTSASTASASVSTSILQIRNCLCQCKLVNLQPISLAKQTVLTCQTYSRSLPPVPLDTSEYTIRTMTSPIQIDGSLGEGGGQVLRIALSLSTLYKIPVKINNIRAGRSKPGLAAQHLKGVELLRDMCNAQVQGAHIGSTSLEFKPDPLNADRGHTFVADTGTAGCICLLAQVALPCALFFPPRDPVTLILKGGTNVPMGPHVEYLTEVLKPLLNRFGADFDFRVVARGYYPKGGGEMHLYVNPVQSLKAATFTDPGVPRSIDGWAYVAGVVPVKEAHKMASDARSVLLDGLSKHNIRAPAVNIEAYKEDRSVAVGNGSGINVVCTTTSECVFGGSGLGSGRQEQVAPGVQAGNEILDAILSGSCVDEHAQDQLVIFMALASGTSRIKVGSKQLTCHTETAMKVAEIMLSDRDLRFKLCEDKGVGDSSCYTLECEGCGYQNTNAG